MENSIKYFGTEDITFTESQIIQSAGDNLHNQKWVFSAIRNLLSNGNTVFNFDEDKSEIGKPEETNWIGSPESDAPIYRLGENWYQMNRLYHQEAAIREFVENRRTNFQQFHWDEDLKKWALKLFNNEQKWESPSLEAIKAILDQTLLLLTGGPGTGKTFTIVRMIAALFQMVNYSKEDIVLAAPTGKAAARMAESVRDNLDKLSVSQELKAQFPNEGKTLHRLLGITDNPLQARFNEKNKLDYKVIIVDEASMIDVNLFYALIKAIRIDTKLILVGDPNQLPSVEAGKILYDLCLLEQKKSDSIKRVHLTFSHRFKEESGIGKLAKYVNEGRAEDAFNCLSTEKDLDFKPIESKDSYRKLIKETIQKQKKLIEESETPEKAFQYFKSVKVLTALREGEFGSKGIHKLIDPNFFEMGTQIKFNHGLPIMIQKNDYFLNLFNSDVGIVLQSENGLIAYFESGEKSYQQFKPTVLNEIEPAYAMTVHKSQGSEFDEVFLVLPDKIDENLITRELIYTAITRAKSKFTFIGKKEVFQKAVQNPSKRVSSFDIL